MTTTGRDRVARLDVAARNELQARVAVGHAADLDRGDVAPKLGKPLGLVLVIGERHRDVDLVGLVEHIGRAEARQRVVWRRPRLPGEHPD